MQKVSLSQRVAEILMANPNMQFTARKIAEHLFRKYPEDYKEKRKNSRFEDDKAFIQQIVAEIGAHKKLILKKDAHILCQDEPRPRVFWYDPGNMISSQDLESVEEKEEKVSVSKDRIVEQDLYPMLIDYLKREQNLYCRRIDERRSKNSYGSRGNRWLYPDVVAIQLIDENWDRMIRECTGQRVRFWSFEVKKEINGSNARQSFFQAVSNSSWANEGYLVASSITANNQVKQELRMLSALHGIGVILLDSEKPSASNIFLPAKTKVEADWQSINRILKENADFKDFIKHVSIYYQTGRILENDWNKIKK